MLERIQKYRRDLHQIPELELELPKTQRYLQEALRDLPCTLSSPIPSSVVAFFDAGKKESIAFRKMCIRDSGYRNGILHLTVCQTFQHGDTGCPLRLPVVIASLQLILFSDDKGIAVMPCVWMKLFDLLYKLLGIRFGKAFMQITEKSAFFDFQFCHGIFF